MTIYVFGLGGGGGSYVYSHLCSLMRRNGSSSRRPGYLKRFGPAKETTLLSNISFAAIPLRRAKARYISLSFDTALRAFDSTF